LQEIRLTALRDCPSAFLSSLELEEAYDEQRWRQELTRGDWNILLAGDEAIGLLGVTRGKDTLPRECHFEQLWIAPGFRRIGAGSMLLQTALDRLRGKGEIRTVSLYVLNGNPGAMIFYEKFGFQNTNEPHSLPCHTAGGEELMRLYLG
jgi:ribosomal protein S18 acetylase RimI-like enzyme